MELYFCLHVDSCHTHVELVESLDTDYFINFMQQIINQQLSRRRSSLIGSDFGTKFKVAVKNYK